jgi:hypothetical protein
MGPSESAEHTSSSTPEKSAAAPLGTVAAVAGQAVAVVASGASAAGLRVPSDDPDAVDPLLNPASQSVEALRAVLARLAGVAARVQEEAIPDEIEQLADLIPMDISAFDEALAAYLPEIDEVGSALSNLLTADSVSPWVMGVAATSASFLLLRRIAVRDRRTPLVGEEGGESMSSWLLDKTSTNA